MDHTEPDQRRLEERLAKSDPPRGFATQVGWTTFGASLGACLGVVLSKQTGWMLVLAVVLVPLVSVTVVLLLWHAMRGLGRAIVRVAWRAMDADPPMGHGMRACPECGDISGGVPVTRCCETWASDAPPRDEAKEPYCPTCKEPNPVYECCGNDWVKGCTDKWRQLPPKWPDDRSPLLWGIQVIWLSRRRFRFRK